TELLTGAPLCERSETVVVACLSQCGRMVYNFYRTALMVRNWLTCGAREMRGMTVTLAKQNTTRRAPMVQLSALLLRVRTREPLRSARFVLTPVALAHHYSLESRLLSHWHP